MKIPLLVISIVLLNGMTAFAQSAFQDSLKANEYVKKAEALAVLEKDKAKTLISLALPLFSKWKMWEAYYRTQYLGISLRYEIDEFDAAIQATEVLGEELLLKVGEKSVERAFYFKFLASRYAQKGERIKALAHNKKALELAEQHLGNEDERLAGFIEDVGGAYVAARQANQGLSYLQKAESILSLYYDKSHPKFLHLAGKLVDVYASLGDFEKGKAYAQLQLDIAAKNYPNKTKENAQAISTMATYWYYYTITYQHSKKEGVEKKEVLWGRVFDWQHKAVQAYRAALGEEHILTASAWFNLGAYYKDSWPRTKASQEKARGYILEGAKIYEKIYKGLHPALSVAYRNIAATYLDAQRNEKDKGFVENFQYLNKALAAVLPNFKPHKDSLHAIPDFSKPENLLCLDNEKVYRVLREKSKNYLRFYWGDRAMEILIAGKKMAEAGELFIHKIERSVTKNEDELSLLLFLNRFYNYQIKFNKILSRRTKLPIYLEKAFECSEKNKSTILLRSLKADGASKTSLLPARAEKKEKDLKKQLVLIQNNLLLANKKGDQAKILELQEQLYTVNKVYDAFILELQDNYPDYFNLQYHRTPASVKAIQEQLLNDTTMLIELHQFYEYKPEALNLFAVYKDSLKLIQLPKKTAIGFIKNIEKYLTPFKSMRGKVEKKEQEKDKLSFAASSYHIYKEVLQLDKLLSGNSKIKRLIIIPDDVYNYIPFELLIKEKPSDEKDYRNLDYLIKDYTISYAYSATFLMHHLEQKKNAVLGGGILGFAADYSPLEEPVKGRLEAISKLRKSLIELPGARNELSQFKTLYAGDFYFEKEANEQNFKAANFENYSIIHLAMHGLLDGNNAMASSLAFTENGDSLQDNFLHAYELMNMNIKADLVVLSACETGLGAVAKGEGVLSLARTFAYAGVPSMIMTLWGVNDESTAIVMKSFYQYLKEGMPKDQALRQAKLSYLKNSKGLASHPMLWGPYILVGDSNPILLYSASSNYRWYGIFLIGAILLFITLRWFYKQRKQENKT